VRPIDDDALLAEQKRYYDERAPIYDQVYLRQGEHGSKDPAFLARWRAETEALESFVDELPGRDGAVLELACGTGLFTRLLARSAGRMACVDQSARMLELNRERVGDDSIRYLQADLFEIDGQDPFSEHRFDLIFMGFFLSHVPPSRWRDFWKRVSAWLAPEGVVGFVDDRAGPDRPLVVDATVEGPDHAHVRRLGEREFVIVKRFLTPDELRDELAAAGLEADIGSTDNHFLYGTAHPV
jgi:SAM-dependent methyltransferase